MKNKAIINNQIAQWYGKALLEWYFHIERDLPWRKNHDPYRIWVSEIMLQQTRVDTVIPFYERFMRQFPTVADLANAPEEEVLKCWEGLGYYSRARNLQAGAKMVLEQFDGIVPQNKDLVASIKGVGPYTCGAIMSIAFNEPVPAVDGNVMRVISRFYCLEDDIAKPATRKNIEGIVEKIIPEGQARYFNQALMELGALICTPKSPNCLICPVMEHCEARLQGKELEIPVKTKAKKAKVEYRVGVLAIKHTENGPHIYVRQRPNQGLLANMWELPHKQIDEQKSYLMLEDSEEAHAELANLISEEMNVRHQLLIRPLSWFIDIEHIFSHIHWKMRFYIADLGEQENQAYHLLDDSLFAPNKVAEMKADYQKLELATTNAEADRQDISEQSQEVEVSEQSSLFINEQWMEKLPFPNVFLKVISQFWKEKDAK